MKSSSKKVKQQKCIDLILLTLDVIWWYENKHTKKCHARCIRTIPSDIYSEVFEWRNLKRNQFQNFSCIQICLKPTWYLSLPWSPLAFPKKNSTQVWANFSPRRLVRDSLAFRCTFCRDRPAATAQTAAPLSKLTLDLLGVRKQKGSGENEWNLKGNLFCL